VMGNDLSPQKARILLMLLLQNATKGQKELQAAFKRPVKLHAVRFDLVHRRARKRPAGLPRRNSRTKSA